MSLLTKLKDRLFYGWVVVINFLITGTALWGTRLSFGIFFKSLENEFNLARVETSAIFSVYMALSIIFAIIGGRATDRYGPKIVVLFMGIFTGLSLMFTSQVTSHWQLFLTYSLLLSMGTGTIFIVIMSTVSRWFDKKRGLALGIACSGSGLGIVVVA
ncbi:MFS transporter, partial [Chloroflexota bacterium]